MRFVPLQNKFKLHQFGFLFQCLHTLTQHYIVRGEITQNDSHIYAESHAPVRDDDTGMRVCATTYTPDQVISTSGHQHVKSDHELTLIRLVGIRVARISAKYNPSGLRGSLVIAFRRL